MNIWRNFSDNSTINYPSNRATVARKSVAEVRSCLPLGVIMPATFRVSDNRAQFYQASETFTLPKYKLLLRTHIICKQESALGKCILYTNLSHKTLNRKLNKNNVFLNMEVQVTVCHSITYQNDWISAADD